MEKILQQDWEELIETVSLGKVETLNAKLGVYLQIRPKAADSKAVRKYGNWRRWHTNSNITSRFLPANDIY